MNQSPTTVLFVSTRDAVRGILAEALLRHTGADRFVAFSAGCNAAFKPDERTLEILDEKGVFVEGLQPQSLERFFESPRSILVDVIVTLSEEAREHCPVWPGDPVRVHWPVDDPCAAATDDERETKFRRCFEMIQNRVEALIKQRSPQSSTELMFQLRSISSVV
ncbi:MAG: arsenate reductase ArsC [Bdellovibrionales bacterium]|jgi:arsenate reductase